VTNPKESSMEIGDIRLLALVDELIRTFGPDRVVHYTIRDGGQKGSQVLTVGFYTKDKPSAGAVSAPKPPQPVPVGAHAVQEVKAVPSPTVVQRAAVARTKGYTGEACVHCGSFETLRTGKCLYCASCHQSSGCS